MSVTRTRDSGLGHNEIRLKGQQRTYDRVTADLYWLAVKMRLLILTTSTLGTKVNPLLLLFIISLPSLCFTSIFCQYSSTLLGDLNIGNVVLEGDIIAFLRV
jgi:hypothetical protein